jgi:hypothetical protein
VGDSLFTYTQCTVDYNSNPKCIPLFFFFYFFVFFPTFPFFCLFFIFFSKLLSFFSKFSSFFLFIVFLIIFVDFTFSILSWLKISLCNFFPLKYYGLLRCFPTWFFKIIFVNFIFFNIELIENLVL